MSHLYQQDLAKYATKTPPTAPQPPDINKFRTKADPILLKLYPEPHPLSSEEQHFYVRLTEGAFGFNEQIRNETLYVLSTDYHVKYLTSYLCVFIKEAIEVNIAFPDLSLLIYSVRMAKGLMANPHVSLIENLHILLPPILSCVLSKRISKYNYDNHWTLRDFSAQVVATMIQNYNNSYNEIKKRVIKIYLKGVQDVSKSFSTLYGALKGLASLGEETIRICVIPLIPLVSRRICTVLERNVYVTDPGHDVKQVKRVSDLILTVTSPILLKYKNTNDGGVSYVKDFGYLGYSIYSHVKNLEKSELEKKNNYSLLLYCH